VEREAKLVIRDARPEAVADAVAALDELAGARLVPAGEVILRDVYVDTPARTLGERGDGLRLRMADGETLLALKGASREVDPGVQEREEIEAPWSAAALDRLRALLAARGLTLREAPRAAEPVATLRAMGLETLQERTTHRRLRNAVEAGSARLAELAIDAVTYHLAGGDVRHHEVEIEAKAPAGAAYLPRAAAALSARFGGSLIPWNHGKLELGLAIARLLAAGDAGPLVADGHLTPGAYTRLAERLSDALPPPAAR
jgi:inorganic triphosphatase YgiF